VRCREVLGQAARGVCGRGGGGYPGAVKIGTRALKSHLGQYLQRVKAGEVIYVTDRGKVVAEIRPAPPEEGEDRILRRLAAEGLVTPGEGRHEDFAPFPVARRGKRASQMIIDDRT
jgi:prevent-host-death family protein